MIIHNQSGYRIRNVGGRNPILLNGIETQEAPIHNGDWIRLGRTDLVFRCEEQAPSETAAS
jgi:hypothetical protein